MESTDTPRRRKSVSKAPVTPFPAVSHTPRIAPSTRLQSSTQKRTSNQYGHCRTDREKVDHILGCMRDTGMTIQQFIRAYVTAEKGEMMARQAETHEIRLEKLATVLAEEDLHRKLIQKWNTGRCSHTILRVQDMLREMDQLGSIKEFGAWDETVDPGKLDFGNLYGKTAERAPETVKFLNRMLNRPMTGNVPRQLRNKVVLIASMFRRAQVPRKANLICLQTGLYLQSIGVKRRAIGVLSGLGICSYPKSIYQANKKLHTVAENHIRQYGKDKCTHYSFDNIDIMDRVGEHGHGRRDNLEHFTTGKAFRSIEVPKGGLKMDMLHEDQPMLPSDITDAAGLQYGKEAIMFSKYLIWKALLRSFGPAICAVYGMPDMSADKVDWDLQDCPHAPIVERLNPQRTIHASLKLIYENEGSVQGTHAVVEAIMEQLGRREMYEEWVAAAGKAKGEGKEGCVDANMDATEASTDDEQSLQAEMETHWRIRTRNDTYRQRNEVWNPSQSLTLMYGDQKTVSNLRTFRKECLEEDDEYDRMQWLLPIPGLFHLKLCLIQAIENNFNGRADTQTKSGLLCHKEMMQRRICPSIHAPHSHIERLVYDSFDARVLAFVYEELNIPRDDYEAVANHLGAFTVSQLKVLIEKVYEKAFTISARSTGTDDPDADAAKAIRAHSAPSTMSKKKKKKSSTQTDMPNDTGDPGPARAHIQPTGLEERTNHIRFLQIVETYHLLVHAIKFADIGLLRHVIDRCILIFHARSHKNYAFIMLWLKWLTDTDAADKDLQRAILANGLVNLSGRPDSWFEIDRANEQLNLFLKDLIRARRNGTFNLRRQLDECTLLATHTGRLKEKMESAFGEFTDTKHTHPKSIEEIHYVAVVCKNETLHRKTHTPADSIMFYAMDLMSVGAKNLLVPDKRGGGSSRLEKFNQNVVHIPNQVVIQDNELMPVDLELPDPSTDPHLQRFPAVDRVPGLMATELDSQTTDLTGLSDDEA